MDAKIFRVNYKSDFILTLTSDAGWMTPFCIKFWTGSPMLAYYASYDGETYTHCTYDPSEPTKLTVQFDDHHLPIGNLKYQVAYHFTVADFPENTEDEVTNQANVTTVIDGDTYQVMLDLNGETAPEIQFSLPAYANELQRIQNEQTRIAQEQQRIANEQTRINQEAARVTEFNGIVNTANADHQRANEDHSRAQTDHQNALADRSQAASDHSRAQSDHSTASSDHSQANSDHSRAQSDHNTATSDHQTALSDHTQSNTDHTRAESDHTRATADSSTAAADHRTASTDHTQANTDHARAESDHQRVETDLAEVEEFSNSLGPYDISAAHATGSTLATYSDLATALGPNGSNIPEALRKGGMSVKFVLTSDNNSTKYVQYRLMATSFSTTEADWQGVDDEPTAGSHNLVESGGVADAIASITGAEESIDISALTESSGIISLDNGKWGGVGGTQYMHAYLTVTPGESYKIAAGSNRAILGVLKSQETAVQGNVASFCDACFTLSIAANTTVYIKIPVDGACICFNTLSNNVDIKPSGVYKIIEGSISSARSNELGEKSPYYTYQLKDYRGIINNGVWSILTSTSYTHKFVHVSPGDILEIIALNDYGTYYTFLTTLEETPTEGATPSYCTGYTDRVTIAVGTTKKVTAPNGANWLYVQSKSNGNIITPSINIVQSVGSISTKMEAQEEDINQLNNAVEELERNNAVMYLPFNTDRQTTRLQVASVGRKEGLILCYIENGELVEEVYNNNVFTDAQWKGNNNWISKEDDFKFYDGTSASIKALDINLAEINGDISSLKVIQITQYYAGDDNYYIVCSIDGNVRTAVVTVGDNLVTLSTSTQSVKISLTIESLYSISINKYFRKEYIELVKLQNKVDSIVPLYWNDSLKLAKYENLRVLSGTYGSSGTKYGVTARNANYRFAVDFKIDVDVNTVHDDVEIAKIGDNTIRTFCAAPTLLQESYTTDNSSYVQEVKYNSGFKIGTDPRDNTIRRAISSKPLVGETSMMIWLKGSFTTMSLADLQTREQWLEDNQDYILKIENDTLSIERNGIGNDGETFNSGATSVIFTTSLKSDDVYKTIGALYSELSALDYLKVRLINSDVRKTCADLAQVGTVRMVGNYRQQLDVTSNSVDYYYDSYPIPLRYKIDESWHTLEVVSIGSTAYVYLDGYKFTTTASQSITIGSNGITLSNLEFWDGCFGDDAAFNDAKTQYSSKRTPSMFAFMGHYTYDNYEGNGSQPSDSTNQTSSRLETVCSLLKKYNYHVINFAELGNLTSQRQISYFGNKVALFCFDDLTFVPLYMNKATRAHVSRYGFPMNFAVIHSQLQANSDAQAAVLPMRLNGWCCATHSLRHDVPIPRKNSINLYNELMQILDDCDIYKFINNVFVYNWSGAWCNTYNMLKMCGYVAAIDSTGGVTHPYCNQYNLPRYNFVDNAHTIDEIEALLVK